MTVNQINRYFRVLKFSIVLVIDHDLNITEINKISDKYIQYSNNNKIDKYVYDWILKYIIINVLFNNNINFSGNVNWERSDLCPKTVLE